MTDIFIAYLNFILSCFTFFIILTTALIVVVGATLELGVFDLMTYLLGFSHQ